MTQHASTPPPDGSPLSALEVPLIVPDALSEGPVRFLLVSGHRDDGGWGLVGAHWLSIDGQRGGFLIAPRALWLGSELARSFRSAIARGWTPESIYRYWQRRIGPAGSVMIDPQEHADTLFQVARRLGAL
jgi:hypothetical protein